MTDDELRSLVRETVTRVLGQGPAAGPLDSGVSRSLGAGPRDSGVPGSLWAGLPPAPHLHASHARFTLPRGADGDGPCLIEPSVRCNHCGYCQSMGH